MKTTVHIADPLLREAQRLAAQERTTLKALIDEGLRKVIKERSTTKPFKLRDASVGGQGLSPELEDSSWDKIRELAYEGRGG